MDCRILIDAFVKCEMQNHQSYKVASCGLRFSKCVIINVSHYMHDVTPKVVAIAVKIVMAMWMIFCQISCLFIVVLVFVV